MKQIVYVSTAINLMSEAALINILEIARKRNQEYNITGLLLYSGGFFIQLIEGVTADVNLIFKAIERNTNHKNVIKLVDHPATHRTFPEWSMGFSLVHPSKANELVGFLKSTDEIINDEKKDIVIRMLKTFIANSGLKINY